jgi:hypothetical protein
VPARIISRAEYARLAGVSKPAITKQCRKGGSLAAACEGDRINLDHPAAQAYLAARGKAEQPARAPTKASKSSSAKAAAPTKPARSGKKSKTAPTGPRPEASVPPPPRVPAPKEIAELEELRLHLAPLVHRFGTARNFRDWLLSLKDIEVVVEKHLSNEEAMGRLISRELVQSHVTGMLVALSRKLLTDAPKTIARRLAAHFNAGGTVEEGEVIVRVNLGSHVKPVKEKVLTTLRSAVDV